MKNEQIKSELVSLMKKELLGQNSTEYDRYISPKTFDKLADEIIILFDKAGKSGKANTCQCEDSQDSYMETDSNNKPTGRLICGECDKPYVNLNSEKNKTSEFTGKIQINFEHLDISEFWYGYNKNDNTEFEVKPCSYKGQILDMEGIGQYELNEIYLVTEGEFKGNAILKKHCKNI